MVAENIVQGTEKGGKEKLAASGVGTRSGDSEQPRNKTEGEKNQHFRADGGPRPHARLAPLLPPCVHRKQPVPCDEASVASEEETRTQLTCIVDACAPPVARRGRCGAGAAGL